MAGKRLPSCENCGRKFRPERYNHGRQTHCCLAACQADRARARKRKSYRKRLEREEGFRERERTRSREAMRRLRAERRKAAEAAQGADAACLLAVPPVQALLVGLVSQLGDSTDPHVVAGMMNAYADRGRRVTVPERNRGSP